MLCLNSNLFFLLLKLAKTTRSQNHKLILLLTPPFSLSLFLSLFCCQIKLSNKRLRNQVDPFSSFSFFSLFHSLTVFIRSHSFLSFPLSLSLSFFLSLSLSLSLPLLYDDNKILSLVSLPKKSREI